MTNNDDQHLLSGVDDDGDSDDGSRTSRTIPRLVSSNSAVLHTPKSLATVIKINNKIIQLTPLSDSKLFCHFDDGLEMMTFHSDFNDLESTSVISREINHSSRYSLSPNHEYVLEANKNFFKIFRISDWTQVFERDIKQDTATVEKTTEYLSIEFGQKNETGTWEIHVLQRVGFEGEFILKTFSESRLSQPFELLGPCENSFKVKFHQHELSLLDDPRPWTCKGQSEKLFCLSKGQTSGPRFHCFECQTPYDYCYFCMERDLVPRLYSTHIYQPTKTEPISLVLDLPADSSLTNSSSSLPPWFIRIRDDGHLHITDQNSKKIFSHHLNYNIKEIKSSLQKDFLVVALLAKGRPVICIYVWDLKALPFYTLKEYNLMTIYEELNLPSTDSRSVADSLSFASKLDSRPECLWDRWFSLKSVSIDDEIISIIYFDKSNKNKPVPCIIRYDHHSFILQQHNNHLYRLSRQISHDFDELPEAKVGVLQKYLNDQEDHQSCLKCFESYVDSDKYSHGLYCDNISIIKLPDKKSFVILLREERATKIVKLNSDYSEHSSYDLLNEKILSLDLLKEQSLLFTISANGNSMTYDLSSNPLRRISQLSLLRSSSFSGYLLIEDSLFIYFIEDNLLNVHEWNRHSLVLVHSFKTMFTPLEATRNKYGSIIFSTGNLSISIGDNYPNIKEKDFKLRETVREISKPTDSRYREFIKLFGIRAKSPGLDIYSGVFNRKKSYKLPSFSDGGPGDPRISQKITLPELTNINFIVNDQHRLDFFSNNDGLCNREFVCQSLELNGVQLDRLVQLASVNHFVTKILDSYAGKRILFYDGLFLILLLFVEILSSWELQHESELSQSNIALIISLCFFNIFFLDKELRIAADSITRKSFWSYAKSFWNIIDWIAIVLIFVMIGIAIDAKSRVEMPFRLISSFTAGVLWTKVLGFIMLFGMKVATFVYSLFQIMADISSFMVVLILILLTFANMFFVVFNPRQDIDPDEQEFGTIGNTFMTVYMMMLGNFDSEWFVFRSRSETVFAMTLFAFFMFLVSIVLLNVLIAVISDSYDNAMTKATNLFGRARLLRVAEILIYDDNVDVGHAELGFLNYHTKKLKFIVQLIESTLSDLLEGCFRLIFHPIQVLKQCGLASLLPFDIGAYPWMKVILSLLFFPVSLLGVGVVILIAILILLYCLWLLFEYVCIETLMGKLLAIQKYLGTDDDVEDEWLGRALDMEKRFKNIIHGEITTLKESNKRLEDMILQLQKKLDDSTSPHSVDLSSPISSHSPHPIDPPSVSSNATPVVSPSIPLSDIPSSD